MNTLPSPTLPTTDEGVFKAWALARAAQRKGGLSPRSLASYHSLWTRWTDYLFSHGALTWSEAKSADLRAYLESLNPRAQVRGLKHVSSVTQRRDFRVLKKIYAFAEARQWVAENPVDAGASVSPTEQMDSLVFHAIDWDALLQAVAPPHDPPLFVSRKKAGRLTPRALFHLANRHVSSTLGPRYPSTMLAHAGPMTLRNSCIVRWLDAGLSEGEILVRAGLRESQALLRLRKHVHAGAPLDSAVPQA